MKLAIKAFIDALYDKDTALKRLAAHVVKYIPPNITPTEAYYHASCMLSDMTSHVYEIIYNSSATTALDCLLQSGITFTQSFLSYHSEYVV